MVSLEEFQRIPFEKKCDVVTIHSNYISMRSHGNVKSYLYHTGYYFIEVSYSPTYKKVTAIRAFNDESYLLPYTETISLGDLNL